MTSARVAAAKARQSSVAAITAFGVAAPLTRAPVSGELRRFEAAVAEFESEHLVVGLVGIVREADDHRLSARLVALIELVGGQLEEIRLFFDVLEPLGQLGLVGDGLGNRLELLDRLFQRFGGLRELRSRRAQLA